MIGRNLHWCLNPCKSMYEVNDVSLQNVIPVLKWVRGEPLSQEHWLELFRLIKLPRNMSLEKLTFGDLLTSADHIAVNAEALKVCLKTPSLLLLYHSTEKKLPSQSVVISFIPGGIVLSLTDS